MGTQRLPVVVFADIDGVLASSRSEDFAKAARLLATLAHEQVSCVLCSGKTRAELERVCHELNCRHPFISEYGAATFVPNGYFGVDVPNSHGVAGYQAIELGRPYPDVVNTLRKTAGSLGIKVRGFSEMSVENVARACGMSLLEARLAKLRDYVELFTVVTRGRGIKDRLRRALQNEHLRYVEGHHFDRVGSAIDPSVGVGILSSLYRRAHGSMVTVGTADAVADDSLLQLVNYPVAVERRRATPHGGGPLANRTIGVSDISMWASAIADIVERIRNSRVSAVSPARANSIA